MSDRIDAILRRAGAEHEARKPVHVPTAQVVQFPLVSKFLARTAPQPETPPDGVQVPTPLAYALRVGPYLAVIVITLVALSAYSSIRRQGILADIGKATCSDTSSLMIEDAGSDVPKLNDAVLIRCAKAYELF